MVRFVTAPTRLQPLFINQAQSFAQCIVHRNRRSVMISAIVTPVLLDHRDVEIPALHLGSARANTVERALVESNRGQARRRPNALLGSRVADVDSVSIDGDGMSAE